GSGVSFAFRDATARGSALRPAGGVAVCHRRGGVGRDGGVCWPISALGQLGHFPQSRGAVRGHRPVGCPPSQSAGAGPHPGLVRHAAVYRLPHALHADALVSANPGSNGVRLAGMTMTTRRLFTGCISLVLVCSAKDITKREESWIK